MPEEGGRLGPGGRIPLVAHGLIARPDAGPRRDHFLPLPLARSREYSLPGPAACGCAGEMRFCLLGRSRKPDGLVAIGECHLCPHGGPAHESL